MAKRKDTRPLKLTAKTPLKIGRTPKRTEISCLNNQHFSGAFAVSFREGKNHLPHRIFMDPVPLPGKWL